MVRSTWSGRAWVRVMSSAVVAIVPLRFLTAGRGELFDAGPHLDRSELADLAAGVALDAVAHVIDVSNCIKCDTCRQVCKFAAVKVWSGIEELAAASGQEA